MKADDWLRRDKLFTLSCRPALPKDEADVQSLTARIWGGRDYVPHVWQEWLAETSGFLAAAEYGGRVVGLYRLGYCGEGEWWLQGLRVHPDYEGRGFAGRLHDYVLAYWQRRHGGVIRLVTSENRLPVHHLCDRTGFKRVAALKAYTAEAEAQPVEHLRRATLEDLPVLAAAAAHNPLAAWTGGLMDRSWEFVLPSVARIAEIIQQGRAWAWLAEGQGGADLLLVGEDEEEDGQGAFLFVQLLVCPLERLAKRLADYRCLAARLGYRQASWLAPSAEPFQAPLAAAGFRPEWERSLYLFEKRAAAVQEPVV